MAAPRAEIPIVVLSEASPTSPIAGAIAYIKSRATSELVTVYADSGTTEGAIIQPLTTDSGGRLTGWLPRGSYIVEITVSGKTPYTEYLDIAPGSNGGVDSAWLASEAVETSKVKTGAITGIKLGNEAVETGKILNFAVTTSKLAPEAVSLTKLAPEAVSAEKLSTSVREILGVSGPEARRGKSIVATAQSREGTSFGLLTTPDQVSNIVMPTDGLIHIWYWANWKESVKGAAKAALFVGERQVSVVVPVGWLLLETGVGTNNKADTYRVLSTSQIGLTSNGSENFSGSDVPEDTLVPVIIGTGRTSIEATPEGVTNGGCVSAWVKAGTYSVSVKFKASSGTVTARNRKLWVTSQGF